MIHMKSVIYSRQWEGTEGFFLAVKYHIQTCVHDISACQDPGRVEKELEWDQKTLVECLALP